MSTQVSLRILQGLDVLLNYHLPATFVLGHLVRNCTGAGCANDYGIAATCALHRCVALLVDLASTTAAKMDYARTICCALLYHL